VPEYAIKEGSGNGQIIGHDKNPEAKARLQAEADKFKAEWVKLGGDPMEFMAFNPEQGQFKGAGSPQAKWKARQAARAKFYKDQLATRQGLSASKPGVQG
jgi:hypothetical protein